MGKWRTFESRPVKDPTLLSKRITQKYVDSFSSKSKVVEVEQPTNIIDQAHIDLHLMIDRIAAERAKRKRIES
jgi:hypothetical protein